MSGLTNVAWQGNISNQSYTDATLKVNSSAGLPRERLTSMEMRDRDMVPVHRVWYKK